MSLTAILALLRQQYARWLAIAVLAVLVGYLAWAGYRFQRDPSLLTLPVRSDGEWIVHDTKWVLGVYNPARIVCVFRGFADVEDPRSAGPIQFSASRKGQVFLNGQKLEGKPSADETWKSVVTVDPKDAVRAGRNEIQIEVENTNAPPAAWLAWSGARVHTGSDWTSSHDRRTWSTVRRADHHPVPALSTEFISPWSALLEIAPVLAGVGCIVLAACVWYQRRTFPFRAASVRHVVMGAWLVVGTINIVRIPITPGFDAKAHTEVILHILNHHRLPLANEGWQAFQSPLYYLIGAPFLSALAGIFPAVTSLQLLRFLSLLCGIAQIELAYRATRRVFPERNDLQMVGLLFAAALPINIYMSHYVGNEPLAGVLVGAVFVGCLRLVSPLPGEAARPPLLGIGLLFGFAMLAKVSALLVAPVLAATLLHLALGRSADFRSLARQSAKMAGWVFGAALLICGWYYVRNWIHFGRPFVSGWDFNRGYSWWQDPGVRVIEDFTRFGRALTQPFYSSGDGFWNGLYASFWSDSFLGSVTERPTAPPWNYTYMAASVLLALVPTALILMGLFRLGAASLANRSIVGALCGLLLLMYFASLVQYTLLLPYFGALKASYTLGAIPVFAILVAAGYAWINRGPRPLVWIGRSALAVWVFAAAAGYVVTS